MMRDDPPAAAIRLASALPCRTHERIFYTHKQGSKDVPQVVVGTLRFRSRLACRQHFGIGAQTLNDWLQTGKARFA